MEVTDQGYRFQTIHNRMGDVVQVMGRYERFQTQAPIRPNQPFTLDFYGKGFSIEMLVSTHPRRATPQQMAALKRAGISGAQTNAGALLSSDVLAATSVSVAHHSDTPPATEAIRAAALARLNTASLATVSISTPPTPTPSTAGSTARTVGPEFHSPFDIDWFDGWGLDPVPFPPPIDPGGGGGGGGGGGSYHSAVRLELFVYGETQPIATWELPEGVFNNQRSVRYEPQGLPAPDAPVRRTTWFRMVATPLGQDPVDIYVGANTQIADVPVRVTSLGVRLTNHLFRVGLEALVPQAEVHGSRAQVSLGRELTEMIGIDPVFHEADIGPASSHGKLRSLKITSVSGAEFKTLAMDRYRKRAAKIHIQNYNTDQVLAFTFKKQIERLALVKPDDVCIRIEAGFCKAAVAVWGFDIAKLDGDIGEIVLCFDHGFYNLRPFSFLDVDFSTLGSIARAVIDIFTSVPTNVNKIIEDAIAAEQTPMLKYLKAFLARAVGASNVVYDFWFADNAWKVRNSADPVIPKPGFRLPPLHDGGLLENAGIIEILSLADALGDIQPVDVGNVLTPAASGVAPVPTPSPAPPPASIARELPASFLTAGEQLERLDRHKSIVVVMMENRSYDHLLGDLMNARPDPNDPYDGAPLGALDAGAGGLVGGVPVVRTRDLRVGTAIPVSPRHSFNAVQFQIGDGTEAGRGTGDMLGFARDLARKSDSPQQALFVYGETELPTHYKLADEFCTCERWFAAHPGPTFPNRFATIMGRIPELENFELDDPRIGYLKDRNLFDALSGARVEWRLFESDLSLLRMFDRYRLDSTNVVPLDDAEVGFEATLRKPGPLPRVMFVEPNFADIPPLKTADDDHPPADLAHGQKFLSRICDLIWDANRFGEVLLVITYDEHGGFYDHVPPPGTARGEQRSFAKLHPDGPNYLGVRVPAFVVSPYVSAGAKNRTVFDHTSILKTILVHNRDKISADTMLGFGPRVAEMADLSAVLDLPTARPSPEPFVRRRLRANPTRFDGLFDLSTLADLTASLGNAVTPAVPMSGVTPRELSITERVNPPGMEFEPQDFHGALLKIMKPRSLP
ncbi:MAG: alkaline phosphatase family protein [Pseudomonadota bacterium]